MKSARKVLVTGGAGYIGSHVVDVLVRRGYEVVVYDNLTTGHREAIHPAATLVEADLLDPDALNAVFEAQEFEGVLHFAGYILVGESVQKPWIYLRDNVLAATNLLEATTAHGVERFIFSSTAGLFDSPQTIPISDDEVISPGSPYGESKYAVERLLLWMNRLFGMAFCSLRYFNAAGAHFEGHIGEDHNPETHLIPRILQVALGQSDKISVYGSDYETLDGTAIRDYIHVMDLAEAHILALEALEDGEAQHYNLGSQAGFSVQEVIEAARQVTGHPIPAEIGPRRAGDVPMLVADSSRFSAKFGWEPRSSDLHKIVETAWKWHQSHPHGYAPVSTAESK